ncbi:MAG TPA: AAA family ATPase [Gammaproteobacteria bacterium]|nr:AAA family ATPase [Gammaproteobacteria bacterium]
MSDLESGRRLVDALKDPACYPHEVARIELVETHISWVLLTGPYAYKIKKPLRLDFLDFSTLERRKRFCEEELRINRRFAPELYLDVLPIGGGPDAPRIGATPAIEFCVRLRQFAPDAVLDRRVAGGRISGAEMRALAETIAHFHAEQPPIRREPAARAEARANLDELARALAAAGARYPLEAIAAWTEERLGALASAFDARERAGAVREGHGDLHLENLVVLDGRIVPFDALEFSLELRTADVMDETAFLAMDLMAHRRTDLAFEFLNRYLEITGDYAGLDVLRFYLVYRALVRAKVRALKCVQAGRPQDVETNVVPYLELAESLIRPRRPLLVITRGLSGSGKTHVTSGLVPRLPALRVRSDLERKRLHGVDADAHGALAVGEGRYDAAATDRTYAALARAAEHALGAGIDVIADATFLSRPRRAAFRALAARVAARFAILDCVAPEPVLRERVKARAAARSDASEATEAVLDAQLRSAEPLSSEEAPHAVEVDTSGPLDYDALAAKLAAVDA